jgi:hypothetical protein
MEDPRDILKTVGRMASGPFQIRLGPSVVNNLAWVTIVGLVGLSTVAAILAAVGEAFLAAAMMGGVFVVLIIFVILILRFAAKNPFQAVLGGTSFVDAYKASIAGKDVGVVPYLPSVESPPSIRIGEDER